MAKRALCVGIDTYSNPHVPPLHGCVQDARNVAQTLKERFGFGNADVKELHNQQATKETIVRSIDWMRSLSRPGDHVCLYIAAHGSHFPDRSGNEADGMDELIVTHDLNWQYTLLRDDEIAEQLARFPATVSVVCIFDMSHAVFPPSSGRCVVPPMDLPPIAWARSRNLTLKSRLRNRRPDDLPGVLFLSACGENEVATETTGLGGAFTYALNLTLAQSPGTSWHAIHAQVVQMLQGNGVRQVPQIHGAASMQTQTPFGAPVSAAAPSPSYGQANAWGAHSPQHPQPQTRSQHQSAWGQAGTAVAGSAAATAGVGAMSMGGQQALATPGNHMMQKPAAAYAPASPNPIDVALNEFKPNDYTVRLCDVVFKVLPFAPSLMPYANLGDAVTARNPFPTPDHFGRAIQYAQSESVTKVLQVANAIDTGDAGIAVYSGVRSAVVFFFGENKGDALETDPQQAVDAVLKLLGLSFIIYRLFPGSVSERVRAFYSLPSGQSLAMYYAAVEVGLPFADNLVSAGGHFVSNLYQRFGHEASSKLQGIINTDDAASSQGIIQSMIQPMEDAVQQVAPYANQIANAAKQYVPSAMNVADKAAGLVATGADVMPVYRYLVARLTAEASAQYGINL